MYYPWEGGLYSRSVCSLEWEKGSEHPEILYVILKREKGSWIPWNKSVGNVLKVLEIICFLENDYLRNRPIFRNHGDLWFRNIDRFLKRMFERLGSDPPHIHLLRSNRCISGAQPNHDRIHAKCLIHCRCTKVWLVTGEDRVEVATFRRSNIRLHVRATRRGQYDNDGFPVHTRIV